MNTIILDGNVLGNQDRVHEYLKENLNLPEYYGKNLDALYDCLTELGEVKIQIKTGEASDYMKKVIRVFKTAEKNGNIIVETDLME